MEKAFYWILVYVVAFLAGLCLGLYNKSGSFVSIFLGGTFGAIIVVLLHNLPISDNDSAALAIFRIISWLFIILVGIVVGIRIGKYPRNSGKSNKIISLGL